MVKPTATHYKLMRDDARPIEFDGAIVAIEEIETLGPPKQTRAAVYRTVGGKFVSEYTKSARIYLGPNGDDRYRYEVERAKVASFDTLEEAAEWFRPGPITTALLAKLQDQLKGERIE